MNSITVTKHLLKNMKPIALLIHIQIINFMVGYCAKSRKSIAAFTISVAYHVTAITETTVYTHNRNDC